MGVFFGNKNIFNKNMDIIKLNGTVLYTLLLDLQSWKETKYKEWRKKKKMYELKMYARKSWEIPYITNLKEQKIK